MSQILMEKKRLSWNDTEVLNTAIKAIDEVK
jgi:hypothetical protein